ncbi:hypothetical protein [Marinobacterium aestuariivivens]|uniref:DUF1835 domain-containing protein n=1 Tax=Marinobacterium aestuariivivens TaxID=1698799 RepID=A0ABW2A960_9GAMM
MRHITNGQMANQWLAQCGIDGDFLAWDDVLHEGPVPAGLTLDELSAVRAAYIASCGWATDFEALTHFQARDALFRSAAREGGVVIWNSFELYDQLHLLQLLHWYSEEGQGLGWPSLVLVEDYLGRADPARARALLAGRQTITEGQLRLGADAWRAFTAPNPRVLVALLQRDLSALPFLGPALQRLVQEYPGPDGLSRTERLALEVAAGGVDDPAGLFRGVREREAIAFMGDASFWRVLERLLGGPCPLLQAGNGRFDRPGLGGADEQFLGLKLTPTEAGHEVLAGERDWLLQQPIDRWIGGVNLTPENLWRRGDKDEELERRL